MGTAIIAFLISMIVGVGLSFFNMEMGVVASICIMGSVIIYSMESTKKMGRSVSAFIISVIVGVGLSFFNTGMGVAAVVSIIGSVIITLAVKN